MWRPFSLFAGIYICKCLQLFGGTGCYCNNFRLNSMRDIYALCRAQISGTNGKSCFRPRAQNKDKGRTEGKLSSLLLGGKWPPTASITVCRIVQQTSLYSRAGSLIHVHIYCIYLCIYSSNSSALNTILPIHTKIPRAAVDLVPHSAKTKFCLGFCIYPLRSGPKNCESWPQDQTDQGSNRFGIKQIRDLTDQGSSRLVIKQIRDQKQKRT